MPGGTPIAQLDLTDLENGDIFEVKTGWQPTIADAQTLAGPQSVRLSNLMGETVTLGNPSTGERIEDFQVNSVTYISVTRGANVGGFSDPAFTELYGLGINTMIVNPYGVAQG